MAGHPAGLVVQAKSRAYFRGITAGDESVQAPPPLQGFLEKAIFEKSAEMAPTKPTKPLSWDSEGGFVGFVGSPIGESAKITQRGF
jgi:hypothetical protein